MKKALFIALICLTNVMLSGARSSTRSGNEQPIVRLDSVISHLELTNGGKGIGGATISDAVLVLQKLANFPICFEEIEHEKGKDGLTLKAAIELLRDLQVHQKLAQADEVRLKRYEELSATEDPETFFVGFKQTTFSLVRDNITVKAVLDELTELDKHYIWNNVGTEQSPFVIIQPRERSILDWQVPRICGAPKDLSSASLYTNGGRLSTLFNSHGIYVGNMPPDRQLDLCRDGLTAREILNLTIRAAEPKLSWIVSGVKGLRWVTFQ